MDRFLWDELVRHERDGLAGEMASGNHVAEMAMVCASYGDAYAIIDGAHVVAGGGMALRVHGRAEAWSLITVFARPRHLLLFTRYCRAHMDKRQRDPAYRRIETFLRDTSDFCAHTFARAMGFTEIRPLEAWDSLGRDYLLCARIAPKGT